MECTLHVRVTCLINSPPTTYITIVLGSEKTISLQFIAMQDSTYIVCTYCGTLNEPHHDEQLIKEREEGGFPSHLD